MTKFLGEYDCKADSKGRVLLPSNLKKQLPPEAQETFVINRGFEKCLVLYPKNEWEQITNEINSLNTFVKKNREFIRYFYRGATELTLDGSGRLLLPKKLMQYADIDKEMVLFGHTNKIEIWAIGTYNNLISNEPDDFSNLAENVMGNLEKPDGIDD